MGGPLALFLVASGASRGPISQQTTLIKGVGDTGKARDVEARLVALQDRVGVVDVGTR